MKVKHSFRTLLEKRGYSEVAIKKLWTWYNYSERKGVCQLLDSGFTINFFSVFCNLLSA